MNYDCMIIGSVDAIGMKLTTENKLVVGLMSNGKFNLQEFTEAENLSRWKCYGNIFPSEDDYEHAWLEVVKAEYIVES